MKSFVRGKITLIKALSENLKGELTVVISEKDKENFFKKEIDESVKIANKAND